MTNLFQHAPLFGRPALWRRRRGAGSAPKATAPDGSRFVPDLSVPGHTDVFVIGDTAAATGADGTTLPGVAPVAKQQGQYVARALIARYRGRTTAAFRYRDLGSLATVGRARAVAQFGKIRLSGFPAWVLWSVAHIYFLIGFRSRFVVALNWAWSYITSTRQPPHHWPVRAPGGHASDAERRASFEGELV